MKAMTINEVEIMAREYFAPILNATLNKETVRSLAANLGVPFIIRDTKIKIAYKVARYCLLQQKQDILKPYIDFAEKRYRGKLLGDPSTGKEPDKHMPPDVWKSYLHKVNRLKQDVYGEEIIQY